MSTINFGWYYSKLPSKAVEALQVGIQESGSTLYPEPEFNFTVGLDISIHGTGIALLSLQDQTAVVGSFPLFVGNEHSSRRNTKQLDTADIEGNASFRPLPDGMYPKLQRSICLPRLFPSSPSQEEYLVDAKRRLLFREILLSLFVPLGGYYTTVVEDVFLGTNPNTFKSLLQLNTVPDELWLSGDVVATCTLPSVASVAGGILPINRIQSRVWKSWIKGSIHDQGGIIHDNGKYLNDKVLVQQALSGWGFNPNSVGLVDRQDRCDALGMAFGYWLNRFGAFSEIGGASFGKFGGRVSSFPASGLTEDAGFTSPKTPLKGVAQAGNGGVAQAGAEGFSQVDNGGVAQAGAEEVSQAGSEGFAQAGAEGFAQADAEAVSGDAKQPIAGDAKQPEEAGIKLWLEPDLPSSEEYQSYLEGRRIRKVSNTELNTAVRHGYSGFVEWLERECADQSEMVVVRNASLGVMRSKLGLPVTWSRKNDLAFCQDVIIG